MAITKLTVENFKSFNKLEVELRPFNIIVGTNASGKSNFLDVIRFLRDIEATSLESAIGIRGGAEILKNFNLDENQVLRVCVETDDVQRHIVSIQANNSYGMKSDRTIYEVSIQFDKSNVGFEAVADRLTEHFNIIELHSAFELDDPDVHVWTPSIWSRSARRPWVYLEGQHIGKGRIRLYSEDDVIKFYVELPEGLPFSEKDFLYFQGEDVVQKVPQEVMLERRLWPAPLSDLSNTPRSLANISAYDFEPRKAQLAVPPTGSRQLDADAENLSVVLREILRQPESKKRLINLVSVLLPFVHDLDVAEFGFGQLITMLTEKYSEKGHRLPAAFASDGTIACLALVVALYFQKSAVAIFEEPDRHVHPHLASRIMQMMNEVTDDTQVIVTTHNPELLRHANLEDILLVTRDSDGHSQITRPADSEVLSHFLQNELGVEDLFTQNLLAL